MIGSSARYSITWLYGEFRIARYGRGGLEQAWQAPDLVNSHMALVNALEEAAQHVDLSARGDVTIVHEHDLHTHEYLEVPSMKRRDLEKFLARKVETSKSFAEEAAWCFHQVKHENKKAGVLLHMLPKHIVDATLDTCADAGLSVKNYVPLTEIISAHVAGRTFESEQILLVVACFTQRIELVLALTNGEALFVRELNYGPTEETIDRLITDINRTARYARQQIGRGVDLGLLMGAPPWTLVERLRNDAELPLELDADAADENFWCERAASLTGERAANFISFLAQRNITEDLMKRWGVYVTGAVAGIAVASTLVSSGFVAHRNDQIAEIEQRNVALTDSISDLEKILADGNTKREHLKRLRATSKNLPSVLLQHLSELTPASVTLTEVQVDQTESGWSLELVGVVRGDLRRGARVLANFEAALGEAPWGVVVTESFRSSWMDQLGQGRLAGGRGTGFRLAGELR